MYVSIHIHVCATHASINRSSFQVCTYVYASIMHLWIAVLSRMHIHECLKYASSVDLSIAVLSSMHIHVCLKYGPINISSSKYAHTCMHRIRRYQSRFFQVRTYMCTYMYAWSMHLSIAVLSGTHTHLCINYASNMHTSIAVLPSTHSHVHILVCIKYAYIIRCSFNHAHNIMHQLSYHMHLSSAVLSSMHTHVCRPCAHINRNYYKYARTCMHQICIIIRSYFKYAHTCMMHIHACIKYVHTCMHQTCTYMCASIVCIRVCIDM